LIIAVTLPRSIANRVAPRTTMRDAYIFSATVSGPTHGVFMSVVSAQYIDDMYCCVKGVMEMSGARGVDPAGTRRNHDVPSATCVFIESYDDSPIIHQMHATQFFFCVEVKFDK